MNISKVVSIKKLHTAYGWFALALLIAISISIALAGGAV